MKNALKKFGALALALAAVLAILPASSAAARDRGSLYLDGDIVRTFVVPSPLPHGGRWAIHTVTFNAGVTPYLLTSDEDVEAAEAAGDVTVTRHPELDNRCPIMP